MKRDGFLVSNLVLALTLVASAGMTQRVTAEPTAPPPLRVSDNFHVGIPREAFGKDYLFSMSVIPQALAATSTGLAGKVVHFELFHDGVDLYESNRGLLVTDELPARRLITTFAIVSQTDGEVMINFNEGMRQVFTSIWYGVGSGFDVAGRDSALSVPQSRVFKLERSGDQLVIRQSLQARSRQSRQNVAERVEVRYFISPYGPTTFEGKEMNRSETRYARFFETQPTLELVTGRAVTKMARFDLDEPVTFYYSANTPEDYVEPIRQAILYWNRAFDREVVRVEAAPEGVTAPDSRYNVIQWVPWDNAGFAYADILVDPLSGESLHGQAYITSVFAVSGKSRARALLRAMDELLEKQVKEKGEDGEDDDDGEEDDGDGDKDFPLLASAPGCQVNPVAFARQYAEGLAEVLASDDLTDEAVLRVSQDYVREVVSHEVGHVLGLRHNFAGSLATTVDHLALDKWFKAYLAEEDLEEYTDKVTSSSMMEYSSFKAGVFIGWLIGSTEAVLPHDQAAIQWGYFNGDEPAEEKLLFATDDQTFFGDVRVFDYGVEPVITAYAEVAEHVNNLPNSLIETFIRARAPRDARDRLPLEQVNLYPRSYAFQLAGSYGDMLQWLSATVRSRRVENAFDFIGDLNEEMRYQAHWKYLNKQVEELGGPDQTLFTFLPLDTSAKGGKDPVGVALAPKISATNLTAKLKKLLDSPAYATFVGLDDKTYAWTDQEKELIIERGNEFFKDYEKKVVQQVCGRFENAQRDLGLKAQGFLAEDDIIAKIEKRIIDLARTVITAKDEEHRIDGQVNDANVWVTDFLYDEATRLSAARMLSDKMGTFKGWAKEAKGQIHTKLKGEVEKQLLIPQMKDFKDTMLSRPLRQWYLQQQAILALLPPVKPEKPDGK